MSEDDFQICGTKRLRILGRDHFKLPRLNPAEPFYLLSFYDGGRCKPFQPDNHFLRDGLWLKFDDIEKKLGGYTLMNSGHAKKAATFAANWMDTDVDLLVVQCEAGISRSAGAAAAILKTWSGDDSPIFNSPIHYPNRYVYGLMITALQKVIAKKKGRPSGAAFVGSETLFRR